jgi:hypothetical protein
MATFPTSVKSFSSADQVLDKETALRLSIDETQAEVKAIETAFASIGATAVTATGIEINALCDLDAIQAITTNVAISVKNGIATLAGTGARAVTLAAPTTGTDDNKMLTVYALTAETHAITITGSAGATATDVATFAGAVGNSITLRAYAAKWYTAGVSGVTVA